MCRPGFRVTPEGNCVEEESSFIMLVKGAQIIDVSLTPGDNTAGFLTPIVGIDNGLQIDYDRKNNVIFWVEGKEDDDENVSSKLLIDICLLFFVVCCSAQFGLHLMAEAIKLNFWDWIQA